MFKEPTEMSISVPTTSTPHDDKRSAKEIGESVLKKQKTKTKKRSGVDASDFIIDNNQKSNKKQKNKK